MILIENRRSVLVLFAVAAVVVGCGRSQDTGVSAADTTSPLVTPAGSTAVAQNPATGDTTSMSDANILAAEEDGDSAEVTIATFVRSHSTSAPVKSYATMLIDDHGKSLRETRALADSLSITPQAPPSDTTAQETAHVLDRFRSLSGTTLDTAFVNHEITDHQHDIEDAHKMAAAASQPRVKALVESSLPVLQKHLDRAQQLAR